MDQFVSPGLDHERQTGLALDLVVGRQRALNEIGDQFGRVTKRKGLDCGTIHQAGLLQRFTCTGPQTSVKEFCCQT